MKRIPKKTRQYLALLVAQCVGMTLIVVGAVIFVGNNAAAMAAIGVATLFLFAISSAFVFSRIENQWVYSIAFSDSDAGDGDRSTPANNGH